ncbi:MAG TPA: hypothetical protein VEG39_20250 [Clostridia bacterium]|nr:hypothetical protein [Clostridia bacterium]
MWENLKNDPFFRVVLVAVIGILAFGLLLNLFSGQGGLMGFGNYPYGGMMSEGGHMGYSGGYGFSFGNLVGSLMVLLVKLLIFILIVSLLIGSFTWVKNLMVKNNNAPWVQAVNSDPLLRTVGIITVTILGLVLISGFFGGFMGYGMGGYNLAYGIASLLAVLIRLLSYILVISLIVAAVIYIKKQYESGNVNLFGTDKTAASNMNTTGTDKTKNDKPL